MLRASVKVVNPLGLHARAAAQLVKLASSFDSNIIITRTDSSVSASAKSILSILTLAASPGTELVLESDGRDEKVALREIQALFDSGFGEI